MYLLIQILHQNSIAKQEDMNRKRDNPAETMRHVSQYQGHQSNPDIVKNVTVFAAVLGTAGKTVTCANSGVLSAVFICISLRKLCIQQAVH